MNRTLTDFLNHGLLPFVGRERELEQLTKVWRGFSDATGLRAARLVGEAGSGKSRLIEEFVPRIARDGGLVVQIKLHPESTASIASLTARALWYSDFGPYLLKPEPEETLPSVIAALRRLARLRPTLIILEDTHLLSSASIGELATLLGALGDEIVTLIEIARPVELPARAIMQRYLVEEIRIEGFSEEVIGEIWERLFDGAPEREILDVLGSVTAGNALALRLSLRSALASGTITPLDSGGVRSLADGAFTRALRDDVGLLSAGMAAHLTAAESDAAARLASLGEVFSKEAAEVVLDGGGKPLDILLFKGILAGSQGSPIAGRESASQPLRFTHTLVHRSFVGKRAIDQARLARLLLDDVALYTILPVELFDIEELRRVVSIADQERLLDRLRTIAWKLHGGPDWELAITLWKVYTGLFSAVAPDFDFDTRRKLTRLFLQQDLSYHRSEVHSAGYRELLDRALDASADPLDAEDASYRLYILYYVLDHALTLSKVDEAFAIMAEVEELAGRFPEARSSRPYLLILSARAKMAMMTRDRSLLRAVDSSVKEIYCHAEIAPDVRNTLDNNIAPYLLLLFDSPEELRERQKQLEALATTPGAAHSFFEAMHVEFLYEQGEIVPLLNATGRALARARDEGMRENTTVIQLHRLPGRLAAGDPVEDIQRDATALVTSLAASFSDRLAWLLWEKLATVAWLRGDDKWALTMYDAMIQPSFRDTLSLEHRLMLALIRGEPLSTLHDRYDRKKASAEMVRLLDDICGDSADYSRIADDARAILVMPILRFQDLLRQRLAILLIERTTAGKEAVTKILRADLHDAIVRSLAWLDARQLSGLMRPIVSDFVVYLASKEVRSWEARIKEHEPTLESARVDGKSEERPRLSMLGAIELAVPGGEPWRPKGSRIRVLLGLLVANEMLESRLTHQEFCAIASGIEGDHEQARRATNVAIFRLRESIGHDAIDTTGSATPHLDRQRVRVDLLDAHELLDEATVALRNGYLARAVPTLLGAMEILRGEVAFPALYEDFFEAAREDLEKRYRTVVVRIGRSLLREGDAANAETILRRALESMPEDVDFSDILYEALVTLGKKTDAERIRRRTTLAAR